MYQVNVCIRIFFLSKIKRFVRKHGKIFPSVFLLVEKMFSLCHMNYCDYNSSFHIKVYYNNYLNSILWHYLTSNVFVF